MKKILSIALLLTAPLQLPLSASEIKVYDDLNRLISETYPDGSIVTYTYDKAGNLKDTTVTAAATRDEDQDKIPDTFELQYASDNRGLLPDADDDNDNMNNFFEYAFGSDLFVSSGSPIKAEGIPVFDPETQEFYFEFAYRRRKNSILNYSTLFSVDLESWQSTGINTVERLVEGNNDDSETVTVRYLVPVDQNDKGFFKVEAD